LLDFYALGAGADPRVAPAVLSVRPYLEHAFGAWRVVGGMSELARAMYERCVARGVDFRFGAEAVSISEGSVTLADGSRLSADVVVAAVDAHVLARLTGARSPTATSAGYSPSTLSLRLSASADLDLPHESVFFGSADHDAADARLDALFANARTRARAASDAGAGLPVDPTLRVHAAPERPRELIVHVDVPCSLADDLARGYVPTLVELVGRRLGLSASTTLTLLDAVTPADRERVTGVPGGSVHGPAITSVRSAILRSPTVQPIKGLLHVGASSRPGPGLPFAALSAWNAAEVLRPTRV
jgi:phytoene dehydrogenase-like protein